MPEIKKYMELENFCYMNDRSDCMNMLQRCFKKKDRDPEYHWLIKENYNNEELQFI